MNEYFCSAGYLRTFTLTDSLVLSSVIFIDRTLACLPLPSRILNINLFLSLIFYPFCPVFWQTAFCRLFDAFFQFFFHFFNWIIAQIDVHIFNLQCIILNFTVFMKNRFIIQGCYYTLVLFLTFILSEPFLTSISSQNLSRPVIRISRLSHPRDSKTRLWQVHPW